MNPGHPFSAACVGQRLGPGTASSSRTNLGRGSVAGTGRCSCCPAAWGTGGERMVSANTAVPSCQTTSQGCVPQCVPTGPFQPSPGSNASPRTPPSRGPNGRGRTCFSSLHHSQDPPYPSGPGMLQGKDQECLGSKPGTGTGVATTFGQEETRERGRI